MPELPVIDLHSLDDTAAPRAGVIEAIRSACETVGFFYVRGHGVPMAAHDGILDHARSFFAMPPAERAALDVARSPNFRGYVPMGLVGPGVPRRMPEAFQIMLELDATDPDVQAGSIMHGPNVWPPGQPDFRRAMLAYYGHMDLLTHRLLGLFAEGLGLAADHFRRFFHKPLTQLRLLHYPTQDPAHQGSLGVEAHTDTGAFTILLQDDRGGLEVRRRDGGWIAADPIAGTFVINIGDMLAHWTCGHFVSTPHRVANRTGGPRFSVPFFVNPDYDAVVTPLAAFAKDGSPPEALRCGPFVEAAYRAAWPRREVQPPRTSPP